MIVPVMSLRSEEKELHDGVHLLAGEYGFSLAVSGEGIPLNALKTEEPLLEVAYDEKEITIRYSERAHFYRGLGLLLERMRENGDTGLFIIKEVPQFTMNGAMLDCSRNAVLTVNSIKRMIRIM